MLRAEHADRLTPAVEAALYEDFLGCGTRVNASSAARLSRINAGGRPLPPRLAARMQREFARDLGPVRLHVGPRVDRMAAFFRADAFCLGTDLFFAHTALNGTDGTPHLDVLRHELAHIVYRVEPETIRCWGHGDHGDITEKACRAFSSELDRLVKLKNLAISREALIKGLKNASSNMDVRQRIGHAGTTLRYLFGAGGEGPRHGEGENYKHDDKHWYRYEAMNVAEQRRWIREAKGEFESDLASWIDDIVPTVRGLHLPGIGPISLNEKEWVKSLANAFHVAQDRASHREGIKGYGHDDARCAGGWNPDKPVHDHSKGLSWKRCSMAAYNKAINNSCDVMAEFLAAILPKTGIRPHTQPDLPAECTVSTEATGTRPRDLEDSSLGPSLPEIYISPYPNPSNKTLLGRSPHPYARTFTSSHALQILAARAEELPGNPPYGRRP